MQNLSRFDGAVAPASREARQAANPAAHSLSSRPSSSPAGAKPEVLTASGPVRLSPATGTAGAAAPSGSGPQFDGDGAGLGLSSDCSCIRTEDGTVFDLVTGRAVSAPGGKTAEVLLSRLAEPAGQRARTG